VSLPIGALFLAVVADVVYALTKNATFYPVAHFAIGVGIVTALLAAVLGLIDYFGVTMSAAGKVFPKTGRVYRIEPVPAR
jgi:uncharacterized membrane protein